jgi:hypothetical protein
MSSESEQEKKKREVFENMSPKRQQKILKKGYEKWDPFLEPKEPPFYRRAGRDGALDSGEMLRRFLQEKRLKQGGGEPLSLDYIEGAREICQGLIRDKREQARGTLDFCIWFSGQSAPSPVEDETP